MARRNPPESMQHHLRQRLNEHATTRWPQLASVRIRYRAGFAYIDGFLPSGQVQPLCRLRFRSNSLVVMNEPLSAAIRRPRFCIDVCPAMIVYAIWSVCGPRIGLRWWGFTHFSRIFRATYGITVRDWRNTRGRPRQS